MELYTQTKTAVVAIIGRPSAGKSTFLNTACGEHVAIVSEIPQTTRDAIRGIVNTSSGQLVFIDTPGYHASEKKLNLKLRTLTQEQLKDADAVLYILDATREAREEESLIAELLQPYAARTVVAINKIDASGAKIDDSRKFITTVLRAIPDERIIAMSAKKDEHINDVLKALYEIAPVAPALYPKEYYTDQDVGFRIAEIIRGEAINRLDEEIPHCIYVDIADMEMKKNGTLLWVRAFLCVERESQKGIVIGKGATMIKAIRIASLEKLQELFDYKIDLDLQVKVDKNWRQKDAVLKKLIK
ncbi:MAG: GTPase Era [Treponema sp.]|nr:GTPase Era [Treponema sp.]